MTNEILNIIGAVIGFGLAAFPLVAMIFSARA